MDNDISHAVEERLSAIEARLDALDGGVDNTLPGEEEKPGQGPKEDDLYEPAVSKSTGSKK